MTAYTWGDEPRAKVVSMAPYRAVWRQLKALCKPLPEAAFDCAMKRAVIELNAGHGTKAAVEEGLRAARPFRRAPTGGDVA